MAAKKVSIIIVNWNAKDFMRECAYSIKQNTPYPRYEVIVVDNGSTDGSIELLKHLRKQGLVSKLILNKENKGFPFAVNQGFNAAKGNHLFMLNNDVLLTKGWLSNAIKVLESEERIAAVGSKLIGFEDNVPELMTTPKAKEKRNLSGAAMVIKRAALQEVGLLDAKNFSPAYAEETDWCYRARNSGFKLVQADNSIVKHFGSGCVLKQMQKKERYALMNTHRIKAMLYNLSLKDILYELPHSGGAFFVAAKRRVLLVLLKSYWNNLKSLDLILRERRRRRKEAAELKERLSKSFK